MKIFEGILQKLGLLTTAALVLAACAAPQPKKLTCANDLFAVPDDLRDKFPGALVINLGTYGNDPIYAQIGGRVGNDGALPIQFYPINSQLSYGLDVQRIDVGTPNALFVRPQSGAQTLTWGFTPTSGNNGAIDLQFGECEVK